MISWKLTVEKILSFSGGLYVSSARSSWFTGDKQGTLNLFFCVVKPLYEHFFDWNCCVDIGSEGKIWKSVQNSFFAEKMKINLKKKLYGPFLWMGFNYLKATATSRRQFTFYNSVPRNFWYSFYCPRKDERNICHSHTQALV